MYELRRLSDVWPTLRGSQSLKAILQESGVKRDTSNLNVWVHPGHVLVAHGHTVLSFDVLPRSKHLLESASSALYSQDHNDPDWLCLTDCAAPLVHAFCPGQDHSAAGLVFADGKVEFWRFQRPEYKWVAANFIHLMTSELLQGFERMEIMSVSWLEDRGSLVACYSTPKSFARGGVVGERPASNRFSVGVWKLDDTFQVIESCQAVFSLCTVMSFTSVQGLVCCQPSQPSPPGLLLFWMPGKSLIQPYLCGSQHGHPVQEMSCPVNFTDLVATTAGAWLQQQQNAMADVLSVASYRWTNEVLVLLQDGQVMSSQLKKGHVSVCKLAKLQPWPAAGHAEPCSGEPSTEATATQLVAQRNCLILVQADEPLRVFDVRSGYQLWHTIDMHLTGAYDDHLWQFPTVASTVGAWNRSGVWMLQCKPVLDQAESIMKFSDANDLPDEDAVVKCCRAAQLCLDWNQHAAAVRFSLQGASLVGKASKREGEVHREVPEEVFRLLDVTGLESPALLLPALVKFPGQRQRLVDMVSLYLRRYKSDSDTSARLLRSHLGGEVVPLLRDFMSLARQYEDLLVSTESSLLSLTPRSPGDVRGEVLQLVTSQSVVSGSVEASQARLDLLSHRSPALVLAALKDVLDVSDFNDALAAVYQDAFQSSVNWESVLVREVAFLPAAVESLVATRFPLFELLCRLLNLVSPEELVSFVEFAGQVIHYDDEVDAAFVHHDKEHYFVQRALAALPLQFPNTCSSPSDPSQPSCSEAAMVAHSQLLQKSGQPHCCLTAARYLVSCQLWSRAFDLAKSLLTNDEKDSTQSMELFHLILVALIEHNQLHRYWQAIMKLRPPSFTLAYLLSILQKYVPAPGKSQLDSTGILASDPNGPLTIDVVRSMISQML